MKKKRFRCDSTSRSFKWRYEGTMTTKELKAILKNVPDDCEVVVKNYHASSEMWSPKPVMYVERSKLGNSILID